MMKILQIGFSVTPGGVENLVMNYYRHIDRNQFQFDFVDLYGDEIAYAEEIRRLGGQIHTLPNYKRHPVKAYRMMKRLIVDGRYDCVHVHMQSSANLLPILVGLAANVPVIAHSHSSSTPDGVLRKILHAVNVRILRGMPVLKYACGVRAGQWMWGKRFDTANVIPNAIDFEKFRFRPDVRNRLREAHGLANHKVIGFVGRFENSHKNPLFLIDVLEELLKVSRDYKLVTVGGSCQYEEFLKRIADRNLKEFCYPVGLLRDASEWYQVFDAFLLPSFFEGFPVVGVEAQASGLPCFFSDRIATEINLTGDAAFLPIQGDEAAKIWAMRIDERLQDAIRTDAAFPAQFRIEKAVTFLENLYGTAKSHEAGERL